MRKIVAIGGGENGHLRNNGTYTPYETENIDKEIVALTEKEKPNFLLLAHAQNNYEFEERYYNTMKKIYGDRFGCNCRWLKKSDLINNLQKAKDDVDWADIIYEGGGDTDSMIHVWKETGFDKVLYNAWCEGKVMCGLSAGANCWFKLCSSDSLKIQMNDNNAPMIALDCLNFIPVFFTPHCNEKDRLNHMKESLKNTDLVGIAMSNCAAIEIIDNEYRIITDDASNYSIKAYGVKAYWNKEEYVEELLDNSKDYKNLSSLLSNGYGLRECFADDADFILHLKELCFKWYIEIIYGWDKADQRQKTINELNRLSDKMKIITMHNKDIGVTTFYENDDTYVIGMLMIHPDYQNKGIATSLLNNYIAVAKAEKKKIVVKTYIKNPARRLYERLGFELSCVDETHAHYEIDFSEE